MTYVLQSCFLIILIFIRFKYENIRGVPSQDDTIVPAATKEWIAERVKEGTHNKKIYAKENSMWTKPVHEWKNMVATRWKAWMQKRGGKKDDNGEPQLTSGFRYFYNCILRTSVEANRKNSNVYALASQGELVLNAGNPKKNVRKFFLDLYRCFET